MKFIRICTFDETLNFCTAVHADGHQAQGIGPVHGAHPAGPHIRRFDQEEQQHVDERAEEVAAPSPLPRHRSHHNFPRAETAQHAEEVAHGEPPQRHHTVRFFIKITIMLFVLNSV